MAVHFDGTLANYYTTQDVIAGADNSSILTGAAWVKVSALNNTSSYNFILGLTRTAYGSFALRVHGADVSSSNRGNWEYAALSDAGSDGKSGTYCEWGAFGADDIWRLLLWELDLGVLRLYAAGENGEVTKYGEADFSDHSYLYRDSKFQLGTSALNSKLGQITGDLCHVFNYPGILTQAQKNALAAGALIDSIGAPTNWWKLSGADDIYDYGSAGNDLVVTGTPTSVYGPSVLPGSGDPPTLNGSISDQSTIRGVKPTLKAGAYFSGVVTSYSGSGLPDGVSVNATTGDAEGAPTQAALAASPYENAKITATNDSGSTDSNTFKWTVTPNEAPVFSGPIPSQLFGEGQVVDIDLSGYFTDDTGIAGFSGAGVDGSGLSITSAGRLTGTVATGAGASSPYAVTMTATDDIGNTTDSNTFDVKITANKLFTVTLSSPTGGASLGANAQATVEITS